MTFLISTLAFGITPLSYFLNAVGNYISISAAFAKTWSEKLCLEQNCKLRHSKTSDKGFVAGLTFSLNQQVV